MKNKVGNNEIGNDHQIAPIRGSKKVPKWKYLGGFACEYSGEGTEDQAKQSLLESIDGMIERRGYGKPINPKYGTDIKTDKKYTYHPGYHWVWSEMDVKNDFKFQIVRLK